MNTSIQTLPAGKTDTKPLWAAVSVLGVAVVALGAGLVYTQLSDDDARPVAPVASQQHVPAGAGLPVTSVAHDEVVVPQGNTLQATQQAAAQNRQRVAAPAPAPRAERAAAPAPAQRVARAAPPPTRSYRTEPTRNYRYEPAPVVRVSAPERVCATCGEVEAVNAVQRPVAQQGIGVGAIAGGVAGAVLGNQIGKGNGRKLATVLGAVGGGYAGHEIEKNIRKETVYQVRVRMDDGSVRTIEHATMPAIGTPVVVDGNGGLRTANGAPEYTPRPRAQPQQAGVYTAGRA